MEHTDRQYLAIDLKSFYATAECVSRGLDPLTTLLVVADESRTDKTICLAVSPALKALGLGGRCRLFEARQAVKQANARRLADAPGHTFTTSSCDQEELGEHPEAEISFIVAPPRMSYYLDLSGQIYGIYLRHVAGEDIFSYSIDEVFIDVTGYLSASGMTAKEFASELVEEVQEETGVTATCGIGTNLYLAKIAMDILGKHAQPDENGVRIAELDEYSYRARLWDHTPLTDFWRIGKSTARKLEEKGMHTMGDVAALSVGDQEWFYRVFGIDAEILLDHAWGVEPCTVADVKAFEPENNSICDGQVLPEPYPYDKARLIIREMADNLMYQLMEKGMTTDLLTMDLAYDRENCDNGTYKGKTKTDNYGRTVPVPAHGSQRLDHPTNLGSELIQATVGLFDRIADRNLSIRKITITAGDVVPDEGFGQLDLFTDPKEQETEKNMQKSLLEIREKFGKNAVLKGSDLLDGATTKTRNDSIGGHKA